MFKTFGDIDDELYLKFVCGKPWGDYLKNIKDLCTTSSLDYNLYIFEMSKFSDAFPIEEAMEHYGKYYFMLYCELDGPTSTFDYIVLSNNDAYTVYFEDEGKVMYPDSEYDLQKETHYRFI